MIEFTTPVGRLVTGHPMVANPKKNKDGTPKLDKDGNQQLQFYSGFAIPKSNQQEDWKQTEWGQKLYNEAVTSFPNGEYGWPKFAWKIVDGDSNQPNEKGKIPNQREGWPGHWILSISNGFPFSCYHDGKFNPFESIKDKNEIKTGDYCQFILQVTGNNINGPVETNGLYINPAAFNLIRAGVKIQTANEVDAAVGFGNTSRALPANAQIDPNVAPPQQMAQQPAPPQPGVQPAPPQQMAQQPAPPQPGVQPAPEFLKRETMYTAGDGKQYTKSQLLAFKFTEEQIAGLPNDNTFDDDIPF